MVSAIQERKNMILWRNRMIQKKIFLSTKEQYSSDYEPISAAIVICHYSWHRQLSTFWWIHWHSLFSMGNLTVETHLSFCFSTKLTLELFNTSKWLTSSFSLTTKQKNEHYLSSNIWSFHSWNENIKVTLLLSTLSMKFFRNSVSIN